MNLRSAAIVAVALALGPQATASDLLTPPDTSRYLRWGPLRVRPGFAVPAIGYDDNVFSSSDVNEPQSDYLIRLSPRIEGLMFFGDAAFLKFNERFDYTAYAQFHDQNYYENRFDSRLTVPFRSWGLYGDYLIQRLRDAPATELDTRPIRREARSGLGGILTFGWRTDLELGFTQSRWTNFDPDYLSSDGFTIGQLLDRTEAGPRAKARYKLTGLTSATFEIRTRDIVFDDPDVRRDAKEFTWLPGLEFARTGTLTGWIRAGKANLDSEDPAAPDFSGIVGDVALSYRLTSATRLRLEGGRRVSFAIYEGYRYYQEDFLELRGVHYLNRIFGLEAALGAGSLTFPGAPGFNPRQDDLSRYEAGLRFRLPESVLGRTAEYTLGVRHFGRDSNIDTLDMSRAVLAFGASVGF